MQGNKATLAALTGALSEGGLYCEADTAVWGLLLGKTRPSDIVTECQNYFGFYSTATLIRKRKATFLHKLVHSHNELYELFSLAAQAEIDMISFT